MTSEDIGELLRAHMVSEPEDDPELRTAIMDEIQARSATHSVGQGAKLRTYPHPLRLVEHWRPALAVSLVLITLSAIALPRETWADFPLGRLISFIDAGQSESSAPQILPDAIATPPSATVAPAPTGTTLTFTPLVLDTLPGGFTLTRREILAPSRLALTYQRADGFTILLTESLAEDARTSIDLQEYEVIRVSGTDVLLRPSESFPAIDRVLWTQEDRLFSLRVLIETEQLHLDRETAIAIVEAISTAEGR